MSSQNTYDRIVDMSLPQEIYLASWFFNGCTILSHFSEDINYTHTHVQRGLYVNLLFTLQIMENWKYIKVLQQGNH